MEWGLNSDIIITMGGYAIMFLVFITKVDKRLVAVERSLQYLTEEWKELRSLKEQVTRNEQSAASAHHRIDEMKGEAYGSKKYYNTRRRDER